MSDDVLEALEEELQEIQQMKKPSGTTYHRGYRRGQDMVCRRLESFLENQRGDH